MKFGHHLCKGEGKWLKECKYGRDGYEAYLSKEGYLLWPSQGWNGQERKFMCGDQLGF